MINWTPFNAIAARLEGLEHPDNPALECMALAFLYLMSRGSVSADPGCPSDWAAGARTARVNCL